MIPDTKRLPVSAACPYVRPLASQLARVLLGALLLLVLHVSTGCHYYLYAVPARRMPPALRGVPRGDAERINLLKLRQDPKADYKLGAGDVLAIYVQGQYGGEQEPPPPVQLPTKELDLIPATGYPVPVRDDGTVALTGVAAVNVTGLTVAQAEDKIRKAFTQNTKVFQEQDQIVVQLLKKRTYEVLVVREDSVDRNMRPTSARERRDEALLGTAFRGRTEVVQLEAGENDVLTALSKTGGLPGLDAKNEIVVLRGRAADLPRRDQLLENLNQTSDPYDAFGVQRNDTNIVRIPLRQEPGAPPLNIRPEQIVLNDGDIVLIETRGRDSFFTGGLLSGAEFPLPRDEDLDIMEAIALAGGNTRGLDLGFGGIGGGTGGLVPPTWAIVVREVEGRGQMTIKVDLRRALWDPRERILIQAGDIILLTYKPQELVYNIILRNITGSVGFSVSKSLD
jgi:protein involved in polysaccharide export with SLBB domain